MDLASEVCDNWKTAKELYYGSDGKTLDINAGYTVDLVRISFQSNVTMYGEEQEDFGSDHYWNAVKVDGQWYYVDPCYTDVYTEVMSRDRVETDGDMNHVILPVQRHRALENCMMDNFQRFEISLYRMQQPIQGL